MEWRNAASNYSEVNDCLQLHLLVRNRLAQAQRAGLLLSLPFGVKDSEEVYQNTSCRPALTWAHHYPLSCLSICESFQQNVTFQMDLMLTSSLQLVVLACRPISLLWEPGMDLSACIDLNNVQGINSAVNAFTSALLVSVPTIFILASNLECKNRGMPLVY